MVENDLKQALMALTPRTKAARLRQYLPVIEEKLAEGARVRDVLAVLKSHGLELTEGTFRYYLHQYRKKQGGEKTSGAVEPIAESAAQTPSQVAAAIAAEPVSAEELQRVMYPENPQIQAARYAAKFKAKRSKKP